MDREYTNSHPFISFDLHLDSGSAILWMLLGEAKSKCDHISGTPLTPDVASNLHRMSLIKGVVGTTAIEGNTLTEEDVAAQIDGKLKLPASKEYQRQEVQNILDACSQITDAVFTQEAGLLNVDLIHQFNRLVLKDLELEPEITPGQIREYAVSVGRYYRGAPAQDCAWLLQNLCETMNRFEPSGYPKIVIGLIKAIMIHLYMAWIHPYGDGNGRTARLLEVFVLLAAGAPTPTVHLLSNHYNETRDTYYRKLDEAQRDPLSFVEYAVNGFVEGLKGQLMHIRQYQWKTVWHDYLRSQFDVEKKLDSRRLQLLLARPAPGVGHITVGNSAELTPQLAGLYAKLAPKTVYRDITELEKKGFVRVIDGKVTARTDLVMHALPLRKTDRRGFYDAFLPSNWVDTVVQLEP